MRQLTALVRLRLAATAISLLGYLLALGFFLAAAFSHHRVFVPIAVGALSVGVLGGAAGQARLAYVLGASRAWTDLGGRRVTRGEQPVRFVTWLTLHSVIAAVMCAGAGFMVWTIVLPGLHVR